MDDTFEPTWKRILQLEGAEFRTITGLLFTYVLIGNGIRPSRAKQVITRSQFEKAASLPKPMTRPSEISQTVRGSSYVFAILTDPRVKR